MGDKSGTTATTTTTTTNITQFLIISHDIKTTLILLSTGAVCGIIITSLWTLPFPLFQNRSTTSRTDNNNSNNNTISTDYNTDDDDKNNANDEIVWTYKKPRSSSSSSSSTTTTTTGGVFDSINRPTAGPRTNDPLPPRGSHPLQLYALGTPNGQKVTILLEELKLIYGRDVVTYDAWLINIMKGDQFKKGFVRVNPNSKIPALLDYHDDDDDDDDDDGCSGDDGAIVRRHGSHHHHHHHHHHHENHHQRRRRRRRHQQLHHHHHHHHPTRVFESGAIVLYLCERFDTRHLFLPSAAAAAAAASSSSSSSSSSLRTECLSWVFWMHGAAPYVGGMYGHFFKYAPINIPYAIDRYTMETKRLLHVLERRLSGADDNGDNDESRCYFGGGPYLCGKFYTIADICCFPWFGKLVLGKVYQGSTSLLQVEENYPHVVAWARLVETREGVRRGMNLGRRWRVI